MNNQNFRTEIKNIRLEKKFTLRQVALQSGIDAGYL